MAAKKGGAGNPEEHLEDASITLPNGRGIRWGKASAILVLGSTIVAGTYGVLKAVQIDPLKSVPDSVIPR